MVSEVFKCERVLINPRGKLAIYIMYREIPVENAPQFKRPVYNLVVDFFDNEDEYIPLIENMDYTLTSKNDSAFKDTYEEEKIDAFTRIYEVMGLVRSDFGISYYSNAVKVNIDYSDSLSPDKPIIKEAFMLI